MRKRGALREDIKTTIRRFYGDVYRNPLETGRAYDIQLRRETLYGIIGDLRSRVTRSLTHGSDSATSLSEEVVFLDGRLVVRLSFLGPFATCEFKAREPEDALLEAKLREVLEKHELIVLFKDEVEAVVPWMTGREEGGAKRVRVWNCLFSEF